MSPEGIGRDSGISYSKGLYPYDQVDSSTIFYLIRDGVSERDAIIELVSEI